MEIGRNLPTTKPSVAIEKKEMNEPIKHNHQDHDKQITKDDLEKKLESVNKFVNSANSHLKFTLHEELNEYYVTIVDNETKEVIKEIPPKKLLDMFAAMKETIGLFIDKKI